MDWQPPEFNASMPLASLCTRTECPRRSRRRSRPGWSMPGTSPTPLRGARAVPIYQTTSYVFDGRTRRPHSSSWKAVRQHLHADQQPDHRRVRGADGFARRGRRRARPSPAAWRRNSSCVHDSVSPRRRDGRLVLSLRRHHTQLKQTLPRFGSEVRWSIRMTMRRGSGDPRKRARCYGETIGNPRGSSARLRKLARPGSDGRRSATDRQHLRHALPQPADRAGRGHRHALARRSGSAAMVSCSAAPSSTRAGSTGSPLAARATMIEPYAAYHGLVFAEHSVLPPSSCGRARRAYAISARAFPRTMRRAS